MIEDVAQVLGLPGIKEFKYCIIDDEGIELAFVRWRAEKHHPKTAISRSSLCWFVAVII